MNEFLDICAPGLKGLHPYQPGKPIEELEREYGVTNIIKLASNENPMGPSPKAIAAIESQLSELARYPDGNGFQLKQALSHHLDVNPNQITLGNGSNDILELLGRGFVTDQQEVIFSQHAFAVYPLVTQAVNAKAVVTPAKNWGHDLGAMRDAINDKTRLIFIANPNNPTGTWLAEDELKAFVAAAPKHVLVVVDEAYFEYARDPGLKADGYPDASKWLGEFSNLVVTRTFSKAYGLAGLRVGYSLSHPDVADLLNRIRQPFNVNHLSIVAATAALADQGYLQKAIDLNSEGMRQLEQGAKDLGLNFIPSVGNFICLEVGENAMKVFDSLLYEGVIVRPVGNYEMPKHLRITVGLPEENERCIQALKKVLAK